MQFVQLIQAFSSNAKKLLFFGLFAISALFISFWFSNDALAATTDSMMVYDTQTIVSTPKYRVWDGSAWGGESSASTVNGVIAFQEVKYSPTRDEAILIIQTTTGEISAQVFNGSTWGSPTVFGTITGNGIGPDVQTLNGRCFDFFYEQTSGDAIAVYCDNSADPDYRVWNGTTWAGAVNIDIPTTGIISAIETAHRPGADEGAFITRDANSDVYGMRWTGSAWSNMAVATTWETTASLATKKPIDVQFENTSGDIMFAWGFATAATAHFRYRTYTQSNSTLNAVTNVTNANNGGVVHWMKLAPDSAASSDKIMIGLLDAGADLNTFEWSGSAWSAVHTEHSATTEDVVDMNFDLTYETHASNPSDVWMTYGNSTTVTRKKWDAGAWGTATTAGDDTAHTQIIAQPNNGAVLAAAYEDNTSATDDLLTFQITGGGTTWSGTSAAWAGPVGRNLGFFRTSMAAQGYNSSNEAMMVYDTQAMVTTPKYRVWNGSAWGGEQNAQNVNGDTLHMRLEFSPTRDEAILITYGSTGDIQAQTWNGSAWATPELIGNYTGNGIGPDLQATTGRAFDFKYENTSGDAVVVYADNTADPNYKVWNGTTWSGANNIDIATTGQTNWIKMADSRVSGSDNLAFISIDANVDIYGMSWNGSAWDDMNSGGVEAVWDATASVATRESITVNYEKTSGDLMFVWGDGTATTHLNYRTYVGTTLSAVTTLANANQGGVAHWVRSAADPTAGSNKILIGEVDAGGDLNTFEWSGTAWGAVHTEHSATVEDIVDRNFDIVYETHATNAGDAWIAWGDGATVTRKKWDAGVWGTSTTAGDDTALSVLFAHPDTGAVHLAVYEDNTSATDDILTWQLTSGGTTWSGSSSVWGGPVARNLAVIRVDISSERYSPPAGVTLSGTCDAYDQITDCTDTGTIRVAVNTALQAQTQATVAGTWSITGVTMNSGDVITVFIDGAADADEAVAVTKYDGTGDIDNIVLIKETLTIGTNGGLNSGQSITNTNLEQYDNESSADEDIFYESDTVAFTCDGVASTTGFCLDDTAQSSQGKLLIITGNTFAPGGNIHTHDLEIDGTFTGAANTYTIGGNWDNTGIFTASTSTVTFTATDAGNTIAGVASSNGFYNLTFNGSGGDWIGTGANDFRVDGLVSILAGTFKGATAAQTLYLFGGMTGSGTGTFSNSGISSYVVLYEHDTPGQTYYLGGDANWVFNDGLSIYDNASTGSITGNGTGSMTISNAKFIIADNATLNAGSKNWIVDHFYQSPNQPFSIGTGSTFNAQTSTITYTGSDLTDVTSTTYYNLVINPSANTTFRFMTGTVTVANDLTIGGTNTVTIDAETNDPIIDVNRHFTIQANATFSASSTASFTIAQNFTNSGTFTANTGTVTLDTTATAVVTGSASTETTFRNLTISAGGAKTVQFTATHKFGVVSGGVFTSTGTAGNNVVITSTTTSQWLMNHQGTENITYTTVSYSGCSTSPASTQIDMTGTGNVDGSPGNTNGTCWYFGVVGITVSGTVYQADESTPDGTGFNLSLSNGGGIGPTTTSNGSGVFSFANVTQPTSGDVITIWITGGTYFGTLVFKYGSSCTGNPNCTGLILVRDQVRIDSKNGASVDNSNLSNCDNNDGGFGCNSADIGFDSDGTDFVVSDGRKLRIANGVTFAPGGAITTSPSASSSSSDGDLVIGTSATLNMGVNALSIGGDFVNSGTFSESGTPQVTTFTATATGHNIDLGTGNFDNVLFNGVGGGWSFGDASNTIVGDIAITNGTLSGTTNLTVNGGDITGAGTLNLTGGTLTIDGAGNFGGTPTWNVSGLTLTGSATSTTMSAAGTVTIAGDLSVGASHTLAGTGNITASGIVGGTGIINMSGGTFTHSTTTSKSFGDSGNWTFNNLTLSGASGTSAANGAGSVTLGGTLTIGASHTLNAGAKTWISNTCDYQNSGTFTVGTSTFSYRCESVIDIPAGNYYNLDFSPPAAAYYDLNGTYNISGNMSLGGAGNVVVGASNYNPTVDINGDVSIGSGDSFDGGATATITVGGAWTNAGTFAHNSGTIIFDSNDAANIDAGSSSFYNAIFNHATGVWTLTNNMTVSNVLTISNGDLNASSRTITLSGGGTPFVKSGGTFTHGTSTVNYTSTSATNILALNGASTTDAYYNLGLGTTSDVTAATYTMAGSTTVNGTVTVGNAGSTGIDYLALGATTLTLKGSGTPLSPVSGKGGILSETSTVQYTSGSGVVALSTVTASFNNLVINGTGNFNTGVNLSLGGDLTVISGTLLGTTNIEVQGGDVTGNGIINMSGGSVFAAWGTGNFGGDGNWNFNQLQISEESGFTQTATGTGSITATTLVLNGTLNAGSKTWTITGTGTPFTSGGGTLNSQTSTFDFTGAGATSIPAYSYNNLGIKPGANSATHTMGTAGSQAFVVGGTLTIGNGSNTGAIVTAATWNPTIDVNGTGTSVDIKANTTFVAPANTFTVAGSWLNAGTFTSSGATVTLDAGSGSKTITSGGSSFGSITLGGAATFTPQDTLTLTANLNVNSGTLAGIQNVNVGSSVSGDGDIDLTGGTLTVTTGGVFGGNGIAWDFNNLTFGGSSNIVSNGSGSVTVAGVLSVGGLASFDAGNLDWTLAGSGTPLTFGASASFTANTSKFTYTSPTGITALSNYAMTEFGPGMFYDLDINYAATFNAGVAVQVYNSLNVTNGTLAMGANDITICTATQGEAEESCSLNVAQTGTITQNSTAIATFYSSKGNNCIGSSLGVCNGNIGSVTLGDVVLTSGGALSVGTSAGGNTLTIDTVDVTGATLNLGNAILNITGNGTVIIGTQAGGVVNTSTGTISLVSNATTGTTVPDITYYNLILNKASNSFTSPTNLNINRNLTISAGTLVAPTGNLTVHGDLINNGAFTHNNGTVIIAPTATNLLSVIGGSTNTTFYNFTNTTARSVMQFANGRTYAFDGTFTVTGAKGSPIGIQSNSLGVQWLIDLNGTAVVDYIYVRDSGCSNSADITTVGKMFNQGNNGPCWKIKIIYNEGPTGGEGAGSSSSGGGGGSSGGGSASSQATATATIQSGGISGTEMTAVGSGYIVIPLVCFIGGSPSVNGTGVAVISGGSVMSINITLAGSGYQTPPTVVIGAPGSSGGTCSSGEGGGGAGGGGGEGGGGSP